MDEVTKMMLDDDIKQSRQIFSQYPNDFNRLNGLLNMLIIRYGEIIDGLSDGLDVISSYDGERETTKSCGNNLRRVIERIEMFRANNYSNEAVKEYIMNEGVEGSFSNLTFSEARQVVVEMDNLENSEKEEILIKIDEIRSIVESQNTKKGKWIALRPYVVWCSGKEVNIAMLILPLIMKIN